MPSKENKAPADYYKNDLAVRQTTNTGIDATSRVIEDGDGNSTSMAASTNTFTVQPRAANSSQTFAVANLGSDNILKVDTSASACKVGLAQVNATTLFKEMGLYDFSPASAGYHYPLIANTMFIPTGATVFAADSTWGNGTDPPTTVDVSALAAQENAIAVYWYIEQNITLDVVRYMVTADGSDALVMHLFSYTLDTSSNHGDLSAGAVHANASVSATATTIKTGTFTLDSADINAGKIVIGFVESDSTTDLSIALNIQYHIR